MKTTRRSKFLLIALILQSCTVYQKQSITLNEAVDKGKVKVTSTLNDKLIFKNIYLKDNIYYGIRGKKQIQLYPYQISEIYLKDIKKSKKSTLIVTLTIIGIPILYVGVIVILLFIGGVGHA